MKKFLAVLLTGVLCLGVLTACGDKADNTAADNTTVTDDTTDNTADDTAATKTLTVGTNAEFPPFEFVGDDGEVDGFDIALIKAIGEKMGYEVTIENMEFASLVASIGTKIDASIAGMTVTDERKQTVDFSDSYYTAVQYVIVRDGSDIKTAADLEGKTIGVQLGTTGDFIVEEIKDATAAQYNKAVDAVNDLLNERVDAVIIDMNPALVFVSEYDGIVAMEGSQFEFEPEEYAIALPKGNTELLDAVNAALAELKADGTYDALVAEYIN